MGATTKIEWTHATFNPWRGCQHAKQADGSTHPACENCYADSWSRRNPKVLGTWGDETNGGVRVVASESQWKQPLKWNRDAEKAGERRRVFCASLADVFEDWQGPILDHRGSRLVRVADAYGSRFESADLETRPMGLVSDATMDDVRQRLFALIDATPWLDWLLLTKRPENVRRMWLKTPFDSCPRCKTRVDDLESADRERLYELDDNDDGWQCVECGHPSSWYRPNVWLGTSVSDQATADAWIPKLLACRDLAPVLFASIEPLLGPIDLRSIADDSHNAINCLTGNRIIRDEVSHGPAVDWVITGGESGPRARPMDPRWARSIRDQCKDAGVPFFFKQIGEWDWFSEQSSGRAVVSGDLSRCGFLHGDGRLLNHTDGDDAVFVGKAGVKTAGRLLDGKEWSEFPTGENQ